MKCKCKFPIMIHIPDQGFRCKTCGEWVSKLRKPFLKTIIREREDKITYNRRKEKHVEDDE